MVRYVCKRLKGLSNLLLVAVVKDAFIWFIITGLVIVKTFLNTLDELSGKDKKSLCCGVCGISRLVGDGDDKCVTSMLAGSDQS